MLGATRPRTGGEVYRCAFPVEGIPEQALEAVWHVAPHVLPVALGLVTVGRSPELEREIALFDEASDRRHRNLSARRGTGP